MKEKWPYSLLTGLYEQKDTERKNIGAKNIDKSFFKVKDIVKKKIQGG